MRLLVSMVLLFVACGALAGAWLCTSLTEDVRQLERDRLREPFHLARADDEPVEITPARWFFLPMLFGDFDLQMELELGEGAEVDVLLRRVEPRIVGDELLPFTGRFTALRLSSDGDGVGWRTREQALLGPAGNGVGLAPGHRATVWIEARGRVLRANVAGKVQPPHVADDTYGMFNILARGGHAVLHGLTIFPRATGRPWLWSPWTWGLIGALGALLVVGFVLGLGETRPLYPIGGAAMLLVGHWFGRHADLDLAWPEPGAMLAALAAGALTALVLCMHSLRGFWFLFVFGLIAWLGLFAEARLHHDTTAVDEAFGPDAGAQPVEALAQLVRGPRGDLIDVSRHGPRVFLLGGQVLYGLGPPAEHIALLLHSQLAGALRQPVDVPSLPTADGHPTQQWRLFTRFYTGFEPDAIVLGVGPEPDGGARYTDEELRVTVQRAQRYCREHGTRLVLFAGAGLSDATVAELRAAAGDTPLVVQAPDESQADVARALAAAVLPALQ